MPLHRQVMLAGSALVALALLTAGCGASDPAPGSRSPSSSAPVSTVATTTTTTDPVAAVDGKVTVLEIGDSLGIDLGWGMQWALGSDSNVTLLQEAVGDTGLVNVAYYDWPGHLETYLEEYHPQIVVVFLGANDAQSFYSGSTYCALGSTEWVHAYGERVATMMNEATQAGARVLWVGMPIMAPSSNLSPAMQRVDSIYESEARRHPGVTYLSSWQLFSTPSGQFDSGTTDVAGSAMPLRDGDGIHLATGGEDLLGAAVVKEMRTIYRLP